MVVHWQYNDTCHCLHMLSLHHDQQWAGNISLLTLMGYWQPSQNTLRTADPDSSVSTSLISVTVSITTLSHLSGWNTVSWLWICQMKPGNNKVIQPIYTPPPAAPPTNSLAISFRLLFPSTEEEQRRGSVSRVWSRFIDTKHRDLIWHQS